jgi:hypothetical protein
MKRLRYWLEQDSRRYLVVLLALGLAFWVGTFFLFWKPFTAHAATTHRVVIELPAKYVYDDGTTVPWSAYKGTNILFGPCDATTGLGKVHGTSFVPHGNVQSLPIDIPSGATTCFVAVVIDPQDAPLGRSNVASYEARGNPPKAPIRIGIK